MKINKVKLIMFVLLLTLSLVMTACQTEQDAPTAADGGEETVQEPANTPVADADVDETPAEEPTEAMPASDVDPANAALASDVAGYYQTLADASGAPLLAASAEVSDDELDYIINLNTGVTFNDGTLMDADAVVANFNRWFDPENEYRGDGEYAAWLALFEGFKGELNDEGQLLSSFDGIEKVNDFTVLVHLNRPVPELLVGLSDPAFSILSPAGLANAEYIGTGN